MTEFNALTLNASHESGSESDEQQTTGSHEGNPLKENADNVEENVVGKSPVEEVNQTAVPEKKTATKEVEQGDNAANDAAAEKAIQQNTKVAEVSQTY